MSKSIIIGFDPGHKGGIAVLDHPPMVHLYAMPLMGKVIDWRKVAGFVTRNNPHVAFVEKCHAMPGNGVTSMFKFGGAYEGVLAVLAALWIPVQLVSPSAWKKVILAGTAKDKAAAIAYCRRRWPSVSLIPEGCRVVHDGMADALCIAAYGETVL